jgi:hypothetical protein
MARIHVCWAEPDEAAERASDDAPLAGIAYGPDAERYVDAIARFASGAPHP